MHALAGSGDDVCGALAALADLVGPATRPVPQQPQRPGLPDGDLTGESAAAVIGALLPDGAIVSDEANTSGLWLPAATAGAPPHDWLTLTGGAIGQGLPLATGAAIACPGRRVIALEADGSAMYTISALWTQAREGLDVTTIIFNNRSYAILEMELDRVGAVAAGEAARSLLDLSRPDLDFIAPGHRDGGARDPGPDGWRARRAVPAGARRTRPAPHRGHGPAAAAPLAGHSRPGRSASTSPTCGYGQRGTGSQRGYGQSSAGASQHGSAATAGRGVGRHGGHDGNQDRHDRAPHL